MDKTPSAKPGVERIRRVIKRYSNRKLYDTRESRYVTLIQIAEMVRAGEDVLIIDNATKEDKTEVTLALIISEELKSQPRSVPLGTLRDLIHQRGEKLLSQLREGPIGRLIPGAVQPDAKAADHAHATAGRDSIAKPEFDTTPTPPAPTAQADAPRAAAAADGAPREPPAGVESIRSLQDEVRQLRERVRELEQKLAARAAQDPTTQGS